LTRRAGHDPSVKSSTPSAASAKPCWCTSPPADDPKPVASPTWPPNNKPPRPPQPVPDGHRQRTQVIGTNAHRTSP